MAMISTQIPTAFTAPSPRQSFKALLMAIPAHTSRLIITLLDRQAQARERRQLLGLSDMALKDFGASRADAEAEGAKPFWQA
jgi:uncharacterized protein YjiS (DUF1127 family)